ncbi:MAG TPA: serine hydrolase [Candidatus Saccharimonadia bacterium]|nr:serine hydrolase [Candidatus Saccharimonadia bacterium]
MEWWRANWSAKWRRLNLQTMATAAAVALIAAALAFGYYINNVATLAAPPKSVATVAPDKQLPQPTPDPVVDPLTSLPADVNAIITAQTTLSASATVINLDTGREYDAGNYTQTYEAASTSKLVAVFDYIHQVELGKASLSQTIEGDQAQDIIMRMIVNSDNDAWDKLNHYLRLSGEQKYLNSIGVNGLMTSANIQFSTPAMAKLLQLFYQGKLMNAAHQSLIYGYMAHTTMNKLIPAAVPTGSMVYHKYGEIDGVLHDAAIIQYQGHNFVLVVYTNNPANNMGQYGVQVKLIHAITTTVCADMAKA